MTDPRTSEELSRIACEFAGIEPTYWVVDADEPFNYGPYPDRTEAEQHRDRMNQPQYGGEGEVVEFYPDTFRSWAAAGLLIEKLHEKRFSIDLGNGKNASNQYCVMIDHLIWYGATGPEALTRAVVALAEASR